MSRPSPELATRVLSTALRRGGDFAELFWEEKTADAISGDDGKIDQVVGGLQRGAGIRLERGGETVFAFTERVDDAGLLACAEHAAELLAGATGRLPASSSVASVELRYAPWPSAASVWLKCA